MIILVILFGAVFTFGLNATEITQNARTNMISNEPYGPGMLLILHWDFSWDRLDLAAVPNVLIEWNRDLKFSFDAYTASFALYSECRLTCSSSPCVSNSNSAACIVCGCDLQSENVMSSGERTQFALLQTTYKPYDRMTLL